MVLKQKELFMEKRKIAIYLTEEELELLRSLMIEALQKGERVSYSSLVAKVLNFYKENVKA